MNDLKKIVRKFLKVKEMEVKDVIDRSDLNPLVRISLVKFTITYIQLA
jgi:hypothetical protein